LYNQKEPNKKMKNFLIGILFATIIILGAWLLFYNKAQAPAETILNNNTNPPVATTTPNTPPVTPTQSGQGLIKVTSPLPNQLITSPLTVTGEAKGTWFFEASAPVEIRDSNGKLLGTAPTQAEGNWMTTDFVPFKGVVTFTKSTTATGTIIFMNDNPSGLPENQKTYSILIRFAQ
jgi:hypothetical protein